MKKQSLQTMVRRGVLAVLIVTAAALTWPAMHTAETAEEPQPTPQPAARDERSVREAAYDKDLAALRQLIEQADEATARQAARRVEQMTADHQTELGIEEALRQAGYPSAFVLMQNGAVTVFMEKAALTAEAGAAVVALCTAHAGVGADRIRVMSYEL